MVRKKINGNKMMNISRAIRPLRNAIDASTRGGGTKRKGGRNHLEAERQRTAEAAAMRLSKFHSLVVFWCLPPPNFRACLPPTKKDKKGSNLNITLNGNCVSCLAKPRQPSLVRLVTAAVRDCRGANPGRSFEIIIKCGNLDVLPSYSHAERR